MSDRSYVKVTIHACPEDKKAALHLVLCEVLNLEAAGPLDPTLEPWEVEEMNLGAENVIDDAITDAIGCEGLVLDIQQDPKYEYDGVRILRTPELGLWIGSVNSEGDPIVQWDAVVEALEQGVRTPDPLRRLFARPWLDAIAALEEATSAEK